MKYLSEFNVTKENKNLVDSIIQNHNLHINDIHSLELSIECILVENYSVDFSKKLPVGHLSKRKHKKTDVVLKELYKIICAEEEVLRNIKNADKYIISFLAAKIAFLLDMPIEICLPIAAIGFSLMIKMPKGLWCNRYSYLLDNDES